MSDHLDSPDGLKITQENLPSGLFWVVRHRGDMTVLAIFGEWSHAAAWVNRYIELES